MEKSGNLAWLQPKLISRLKAFLLTDKVLKYFPGTNGTRPCVSIIIQNGIPNYDG